jgi:hypothetical protein
MEHADVARTAGEIMSACAAKSTSPWKRSMPMKKLPKQLIFYSVLTGVWALLAKLRIWPPYLFLRRGELDNALWDTAFGWVLR